MAQIDELVKHKLGEIMTREIEWPGDSLATISKVKTSPDLRHTSVYISVIPHNKSGSTLSFLNRKAGQLQKALNKKVKLRNIPKIKFELDFTEHEAEKIEKLIEETK